MKILFLTDWTDSISRRWVTGCIDLAFDWCQCYCSEASQEEEEAHVQGSSAFRLEQVCTVWGGTVKEAKFPELQSSCGYALDSNKQVLVQCYAMPPYPNGRTGEQHCMRWFHRLVSIFHATVSLKAVLPFDFIDTSGQKPSTLRTHLHITIHTYWVWYHIIIVYGESCTWWIPWDQYPDYQGCLIFKVWQSTILGP